MSMLEELARFERLTLNKTSLLPRWLERLTLESLNLKNLYTLVCRSCLQSQRATQIITVRVCFQPKETCMGRLSTALTIVLCQKNHKNFLTVLTPVLVTSQSRLMNSSATSLRVGVLQIMWELA